MAVEAEGVEVEAERVEMEAKRVEVEAEWVEVDTFSNGWPKERQDLTEVLQECVPRVAASSTKNGARRAGRAPSVRGDRRRAPRVAVARRRGAAA